MAAVGIAQPGVTRIGQPTNSGIDLQYYLLLLLSLLSSSSSSPFVQGIYTYIPETNYVPREYGVADILLVQYYSWYLYR